MNSWINLLLIPYIRCEFIFCVNNKNTACDTFNLIKNVQGNNIVLWFRKIGIVLNISYLGMIIKFSMKKVILIRGAMPAYWGNLILYSFIRMVFHRLRFRLPMVIRGRDMNFSPVHIQSTVEVVHYNYCRPKKVIQYSSIKLMFSQSKSYDRERVKS